MGIRVDSGVLAPRSGYTIYPHVVQLDASCGSGYLAQTWVPLLFTIHRIELMVVVVIRAPKVWKHGHILAQTLALQIFTSMSITVASCRLCVGCAQMRPDGAGYFRDRGFVGSLARAQPRAIGRFSTGIPQRKRHAWGVVLRSGKP